MNPLQHYTHPVNPAVSKENSLVIPRNPRSESNINRGSGNAGTSTAGETTLQRLVEKSKQNTLGSACLVEEVKCPPGVDESEWLASKIVEIFDELNLLAGCIQHLCTCKTCPKMTAGANFEWLWSASANVEPVCLPAPEYFKTCLVWADDKINDTQLFPIDPHVAFPAAFKKNVSVLFKRFFRLYAHVYYHHFQELVESEAAGHLNYNFKHFLYVGLEFGVLQEDQKEMEPLREMVSGFIQERGRILGTTRAEGT